LITLVLLAALAVLGSGYAVWSQNLDVNAGSVTTASAPVVVTDPASAITSNSAMLNGYLDSLAPGGSPVSVFFDYGLPTAYGHSVAASPSSVAALGADFSFSLTGLDSSQTYHYRARGAGFYTVYGADRQFTTAVETSPVYFTDVVIGSGSNNTCTVNGQNTDTLTITYTVGNNGQSSNRSITLRLHNSTDSWVLITGVTVNRTTTNGNLNRLTTSSPSGSVLGSFNYTSGSGGTNNSYSLILSNSNSNQDTINISTGNQARGTYTITVTFDYFSFSAWPPKAAITKI